MNKYGAFVHHLLSGARITSGRVYPSGRGSVLGGAVTSPQRHTSQEETPPDHSPLSGSPANICDPSGCHFGL